MLLSYIVPHRNRVGLFRRNLESLAAQTDAEFEIVVVDNSDSNHLVILRETIQEFRTKGLSIRAFTVDPTKCKYSHAPQQYGGNYNPAVSINVGVKQARGDVIVLTSPEVINAKTNVALIKKGFEEGKSRFLLGWIEERVSSLIPDLKDGIEADEIKRICSAQGHGAKCRPGHWKPINYFIGSMLKKDFISIGGIDERYMIGIGFEDDCFAQRCDEAGFPAELYTDVAGVHLSHPRSYQGNLWTNPNAAIFKNKRAVKKANIGHAWGSPKYILEEI